MRQCLRLVLPCTGLLAASALFAQADDLYFPAPPSVTIQGEPAAPARPKFHAEMATTVYSIGQPTSQEQYLLQILNRARANAPAEANRLAASTDGNITGATTFFKTNFSVMKTQFGTLPSPLPPLAFNAELMQSSLLHSQDMKNSNLQTHDNSSNPPSPFLPNGDFGSRLGATNGVNYPLNRAAENIFAYGLDLDQIHASFEIDWGNDSLGAVNGMQVPPGHRYNDHDLDDGTDPPTFYAYREIGIGIIPGPDKFGDGKQTGPLVATYDIGVQNNDTPFITGVVYKDNDGNGFYTPGNISNPADFGEGVGNVTVTVSNTTFSAITAKSGGYAVPVPGDGTYTVSFSGGGLANFSENVTVSGGNNVEADYVIAAAPPVSITKSPVTQTVILGKSANFTVSATSNAGNLSYQWRYNGTAIKGATKSSYSIAKVAITSAGKYDVVVQNSKGTATSTQATLSILTPVKITTQPKAVSAKAGQAAAVTFKVAATGIPTPSIFLWKVSGQPITALNVTGVTSATLTISKVTVSNAGTYQVTVSNILNGVTSNMSSTPVKLTVTAVKTSVK